MLLKEAMEFLLLLQSLKGKSQISFLRNRSLTARCVDLMEKLFVYRRCRRLSLPVRVSVAYRVVSRVLLLVSCYVETHFLPVALPLLPLALGGYVTLGGVRLCRRGVGDGG